MNLYFFRAIPAGYKTAFTLETARRNRMVMRISSLLVMVMTSAALASQYIVDYRALKQLPVLETINMALLGVSAAAFALSFLLGTGTKKSLLGLRILHVIYPMCFITGLMWVSLSAMGNPRNTMTMYMLAALCVGMFWLFNFYETLCVVLVCELIFSVAIGHYQPGTMEVILNQFMSVFVLTVLFFLSRWNYSMRFHHFEQVKLVSEKTRQLEKLNQAKTEILGVVAHDLRTPLANIEMLASMSLEDDHFPADQRENLQMILTACRNGRATIHDLIDLAKDKGDMHPVMEKVKMQDFINSVFHTWKHQLGGSRTLTIAQPDEPLFAEINMDKLRRVLDNLISNAIKFTQTDGNIHIELTWTDGQIHIHVNDDGIGIPQKLLPYLFDRFSKAGRSGLQGQRSVGLGLSISKKFVHEHRGTIRVRNNARGTTFSVALPPAAPKPFSAQ